MNRQSNLGMMRNPEYDVYIEEKTRWQEFFYRPLFEPVVMYRIEPEDESGWIHLTVFPRQIVSKC